MVQFDKVEPSDFTVEERKIFARYTDATCLEAEDAQKRYLQMASYFAIFVTSLILFLLALLCCGCLTCIKHKRNKRRNNFFGHNNGEDNLKIDHHWQEDSEPKPLYICVRDPNLKDFQLQKQNNGNMMAY